MIPTNPQKLWGFLELETWDETFPTWVNGWILQKLEDSLYNFFSPVLKPFWMKRWDLIFSLGRDRSRWGPQISSNRQEKSSACLWVAALFGSSLRVAWELKTAVVLFNVQLGEETCFFFQFGKVLRTGQELKKGKRNIQMSWRTFGFLKNNFRCFGRWWYSRTNCWKLNMIQWWFAKLVHLLFHVGTFSGSISVLWGVAPKDT